MSKSKNEGNKNTQRHGGERERIHVQSLQRGGSGEWKNVWSHQGQNTNTGGISTKKSEGAAWRAGVNRSQSLHLGDDRSQIWGGGYRGKSRAVGEKITGERMSNH